MAWILDPLSIATGGYIGIAPGDNQCPLPLAIGSDGYIRFDVLDFRDDKGGAGKGRRRWIEPPRYLPDKDKRTKLKLAALAIIAIEAFYDD